MINYCIFIILYFKKHEIIWNRIIVSLTWISRKETILKFPKTLHFPFFSSPLDLLQFWFYITYTQPMVFIRWLFHSSHILNEGKYGNVFTEDFREVFTEVFTKSVKNKLSFIYIWNKAAFLFPATIALAAMMSETYGWSPSIT